MNGIINVYKEKGYTSHDVVAKLRGICRQKKIGHTGTLDPDAEGVLPVCLGTATKVCELLTDKDKVYEAVLLLGKETDTQDISGTVLREAEVRSTETEVQEVIDSFLGAYSQIPPMYSALKVNGKKLCDLARAGVEVERKPRQVHIYKIEVLKMQLPRIRLRVHCSKGTYIRTLCHDIGQKLGCGGCMEELLRTKVSIFELKDAVKLSQIQLLAEEQRLPEILLPVDRLFLDLPKAEAAAGFQKMLFNGNRLPKRALVFQEACGFLKAAKNAERKQKNSFAAVSGEKQVFRVYLDDLFYGIYMLDEKRGDYKPVKIFGQGEEQDSSSVKRSKQKHKNLNGGTDHEI